MTTALATRRGFLSAGLMMLGVAVLAPCVASRALLHRGGTNPWPQFIRFPVALSPIKVIWMGRGPSPIEEDPKPIFGEVAIRLQSEAELDAVLEALGADRLQSVFPWSTDAAGINVCWDWFEAVLGRPVQGFTHIDLPNGV